MLVDYTTVLKKKQFVTYAIGGQIGIIYFWIREGVKRMMNWHKFAQTL